MPASLTDLARALSQERDALLDRLAALSPEARSAAQAPGAWSPLEIAEHVYRAEAAIIRGAEKQVAAGDDRKPVGERSRARVGLLHTAMRAPKKIRVPEGARGVHPEGMAYEDLRAAWADVGRRLDALVAGFPAGLTETPLLRHPISGALTLADALRFLQLHAARHRRQIERAAGTA